MRAGPLLSREFRTAIMPSGSSAISTQLPLGLLAVLLRQRAIVRRSADIPFSTCIFISGSQLQRGTVRGGRSRPPLTAGVCTRQPNMLMHVHLVLASRARARQNAIAYVCTVFPHRERRVGSVRSGCDGGTCGPGGP